MFNYHYLELSHLNACFFFNFDLAVFDIVLQMKCYDENVCMSACIKVSYNAILCLMNKLFLKRRVNRLYSFSYVDCSQFY